MASGTELTAFPWYGGKNTHLSWLLRLLPRTTCYVEPFGGAASVLINREPCEVEVYNDIYQDVVIFFRVLRDHADELIRRIRLTPYARAEFALACDREHQPEDPIERARLFYVRASQVRIGLAQIATPGQWGFTRAHSAGGMASTVHSYLRGMDDLAAIAERLMRVQIECRTALDVIRLYDSPETLFYCDPPYVMASRPGGKGYAHEMTDDDHRALAEALNSAQGMVAVSGYEGDLMDELYAPPKWFKNFGPERSLSSSRYGRMQREVLWTNYNAREIHNYTLF